MKRFIIRSILFCLPVVAILICVEGTLRHSSDYRYKADWLNEHSQDVECLILGNSHTLSGLQPTEFPIKTFNAAFSSQTFQFDLCILKKYKAQMHNLLCVILPVSYCSLTDDPNMGVEYWRKRGYVLYFDYPTDDNKYKGMLPINASTWIRFVKVLLGPNITVDSLGRRNSTDLKDRMPYWKTTGIITAERHTDVENKANNVCENLVALDSIIALCKESNVKILLLNTPTHIEYRKHLDQSQLALMNRVCDSITLAHENVYRLNYFSDSTFVDDDFYDTDHLNEYGAKRLSIMLANDLDSLGIVH